MPGVSFIKCLGICVEKIGEFFRYDDATSHVVCWVATSGWVSIATPDRVSRPSKGFVYFCQVATYGGTPNPVRGIVAASSCRFAILIKELTTICLFLPFSISGYDKK